MSKSRLLKEMDSKEIAEWIAYFKVEHEIEKKGNKDANSLKAKFQSLAPVKGKDAKAKSNS